MVRTDYSPGETAGHTVVIRFSNLRTLYCFASLRLGVLAFLLARVSVKARSILQCPLFSAPFFRSSWPFEFIATWNAAAIQREDAKAQRRKAAEGAPVAQGDASEVTVRPAWRVICPDPQYSGDEIHVSLFTLNAPVPLPILAPLNQSDDLFEHAFAIA